MGHAEGWTQRRYARRYIDLDVALGHDHQPSPRERLDRIHLVESVQAERKGRLQRLAVPCVEL